MTTELQIIAPLLGRTFNILWAASPVQTMTDQKQWENMERFSYLGSMITQDGRRTREIKSWTVSAKAAFNMGLFSPVYWTLIQHRN